MAAFVDSNVLVYAFTAVEPGDADKARRAALLMDTLFESGQLRLNAQVLGELTNVALRKARLSVADVLVLLEPLFEFCVVVSDHALVRSALLRVQQSRLSYWDALIVEAALRTDATVLYTEDMHHGTRYGELEVRNPFLP